MIAEKVIEQVQATLDHRSNFEQFSTYVIEEHPAIIAYFNSEGFGILTNQEKDLLWYCTMVILQSIRDDRGPLPQSTTEDLAEREELNYEALQGKVTKFKDIADFFFKDFEEEELLAFVEDTLMPDEDSFVTPVGRKVLLISLKTIIDVYT